MYRHFEFPRLLLALLGVTLVQSMAIGALLLAPQPHGRAAPQQAGQASPAPRIIQPSELDAWRDEAVLGDSQAGVQLIGALLDNYERTHDSDDLFEAVQWLERGWPSGRYQESGVATRVFGRHCDNKVLRWHWLCDRGE